MELDQFRDVDLVIDRANDSFVQKQFVSQGDYKGRTLTVQVTDNGNVGEVPGLTLNLNWHNEASGLTDLTAFSVVNKATSVFAIEYPQHMMTPGKVYASIQVIQDGKVTNLKEFELTVQQLAGQAAGIVQKAEFSALVAALADSNKFRTDIDSLDNGKVDKGGVSQITWAMADQYFKEQVSGGKTAVVGKDSVTEINIVDGEVTEQKVSFTSSGKNLLNLKKIIDNKYVDLTGKEVSSTDYFYIKDLKVKPNQTIILNDSNGQILPMRFCVAYNSSGELLSAESQQHVTGYFTVGANTRFLTITLARPFLERKLMLSFGTVAAAYEPYSIELAENVNPSKNMLEKMEEIAREEISKFEKPNMLKVEKNGSSISVSTLDSGKEIKINVDLSGSANGAFTFASTEINGTIVHTTTDDITPIRTFATVGANHGYPYLISATVSSHDKITADLGSVWSDGTNDFVLIEIASANLLKFLPDYVARNDDTISVTATALLGNLEHVSGATNTTEITINSQTTGQLYPSIKNVDQKLNGVDSEDDTVYLSEFSVFESYEILDYQSLIDWSKLNLGRRYKDNISQIESIAKYSTVYSFKEAGLCLVNSSLLFMKKTSVGNIGFLQAATLNQSAKRYIPDIQTISGFDFQKGVELSAYNSSLNISLENLKSSDYPVNRYVDMYEDYGFTMGYVFDKTSSESSKRLANTSVFWDLRNTKKSYPIAVNNKVNTANAGDYYAIEGYRKYFVKEQDLTNFTVVEDGEAYYIYIDAHKEIPFISRRISANIGKKIVVLKSQNFSLLNEYVSAEGVTFAINADYGTAVLKILK